MKVEIPNIEDVVKATRNNRDKIKDHEKAILMHKATPVFKEIVVEMEKAQKVGFNTCSVKCEDDEVVHEVIRQYGEAKYNVKYSKPNLQIIWPI